MSNMTLTVRFRDGTLGGFGALIKWEPVSMNQPVPKDDRAVSIAYIQFANDFGFIGWSPENALAAVVKERDELKAQLAQVLNNSESNYALDCAFEKEIFGER